MSEVKYLKDLPDDEWPVRMVRVVEGKTPNPGQGEEHQFLVIRGGTGFIHFSQKEQLEEGEMPILVLSLLDESTGPRDIPEEEAVRTNPYNILTAFEFPNKEAFDMFMNGFKKFGERYFP